MGGGGRGGGGGVREEAVLILYTVVSQHEALGSRLDIMTCVMKVRWTTPTSGVYICVIDQQLGWRPFLPTPAPT